MVYCKFVSKVRAVVFQFCSARVMLTQCLSCLLERSCKAALSMGSLSLMVFFGALGINAGEQKLAEHQSNGLQMVGMVQKQAMPTRNLDRLGF